MQNTINDLALELAVFNKRFEQLLVWTQKIETRLAKLEKPTPRKKRKTSHKREDLQQVVEAYLRATGRWETDVAKEKGKWGQWMLEADQLLLMAEGSVSKALACIQFRATDWAHVTWTISGVTKRFHDWEADRQKRQQTTSDSIQRYL